MGSQTSARGRWRFSFNVMIPVILAVVVTVGIAVAFVMWSATQSDARALARQSALIALVVETERGYIAAEQDEYTGWDDAMNAVAETDLDWIDENLGADYFQTWQAGRLYVLAPDLSPIYAMRDGGAVNTAAYEADRAAIEPLAASFRTVDGEASIAAVNNGNGDVPRAADIAVIDGRPALVGVVPILPWDTALVPPAGGEHFHVAVQFLDQVVADDLSQRYLIDGARFDASPVPADGEAVLPLANAAGETVAWFKWTPERPGAQILVETAPAMGAALLVGGAVIVILLMRLRRSSSELEAARAEAQHRALHDPLTGLVNRAGFAERPKEAVSQLGRGAPFAFMALDLDRFKQVNDTLGHDAGDQLLQQVGQRLASLMRDSDTIARLGGDEFAVIQNPVKTVADCEALAGRIVERLADPFTLTGKDARIGVSVGIALAANADDAADVATRADFALYEAKDGGRNQFRVFTPKRDGEGNVVTLPVGANANKVA